MFRLRFHLLTILIIGCYISGCINEPVRIVSTPSNMTFAPGEVKDLISKRESEFKGMVGFTVEWSSNSHPCYKPVEKISFDATFTNRRDLTVTLFNRLFVAETNQVGGPYTMFPQIYTKDGEEVSFSTSYDYGVNPPEQTDFDEIPAQDNLKLQATFRFPAGIKIGDTWANTPSGQYWIQFTYINKNVIGPSKANSFSGEQYDWNAWVGEVKSNQIEICIQNP